MRPLNEAASGLEKALERRRRMMATLRDRVAELEAISAGDFHAEMSVHVAWNRHPGVAEVFAGYGLPDCRSCPVGADETLAEAAEGYEIPIDRLLSELQVLLRG
ncbi:MAG TPA: hypothetical protein QGF58_26890 [Myxococcota bacterium]|nr:hypothetical protein [Myxococcota bacterium]